jgi:aminopeptidase N
VKTRLAMLAHDQDGFQRWQAAQSLSQHFIEARLEGRPENEADFQRTMADIVRTTSLSHNYRAYVLQIPSEQDIARVLAMNVDPARVHQVREAFTHDLAVALAPALQEVLAGFGEAKAFKPTAAQAGERALKLGALGLASKVDSSFFPILLKLYDKTDNMTERFGALGLLLRNDAPDANDKLAAFEKRFGNNPIVLDKWFALQAMQPSDNTLATLEKLMQHSGFSLDNPNRVRAVVGSFAYNNPTQFHRADGEGYAFVAKVISQIDGHNSQLSARLATAFGNWRRYTPDLQAKAKAELMKLQSGNLSRDLSDIVERSLQN